jgi:hypothetical protein
MSAIGFDRAALVEAIARRVNAVHQEAVAAGAHPAQAVLEAAIAASGQLAKHFAAAHDHQARVLAEALELIAGLHARLAELEGDR